MERLQRMSTATRHLSFALAATLVASLAIASCGDDASTSAATSSGDSTPAVVVTPAPYGEPFDKLSEWHLFDDLAKHSPADRVRPYIVNSPLFSDYTTKSRWLYVPEGATIGYSDDAPWEFPVGTILVKSFGYAADLRAPDVDVHWIETRLLYREPDGWTAHTYVYGDDGDATRTVAGDFVQLELTWSDGAAREVRYHVPNTNECKDCHQSSERVLPLGVRTRQLDRPGASGGGSQVDALFELGWFDRAPASASARTRLVDPWDESGGDVSLRARSYFDANCAHCHDPKGMAASSGLYLDFDDTDPAADDSANWGVCKIPTSAGGANCGNTFDVVPGDPDASILVCRMTTLEIDKRMPPLGSAVVHAEGLALMRAWIESLPPASCSGGVP
jgi:uncharacterized repeat protein (TIGR03806 family)